MNSEEVWINILIPLLFGQLFLYLKTIYDNYISHKNEQRKIKFDEELNSVRHVLQNLYWPVYIKLLCIYQLNYNIPSDISSSAFFIVLTALSNNSELIIKNVHLLKKGLVEFTKL